MSNKILFVFEGADTEHRINSSVLKCFFAGEDTVIECVFGTDIYQLYKTILADDDFDTFSLLKERDKKNTLKDYTRNDFAEIYLFFDYDGHATEASVDKVKSLLSTFDNETEKGKLLISYPMVESIKHIKNYEEFKDLCVCCNENIGYKELVAQECQEKVYLDFRKYNSSMWQHLLLLHLSKMNYIVYSQYQLPTNIISQDLIYNNQLAKYIAPSSTVGVLSAFPAFLHDYFGNERTVKFISSGVTHSCQEGDTTTRD